ncbi:MAG: branched-chain amino acid transport system ATP-binding protein [Thermoleophilaceae bacterium]|nr:branched-chain amino acid transport system ATP-binding protein [Thermoleophilaceae bacterium]
MSIAAIPFADDVYPRVRASSGDQLEARDVRVHFEGVKAIDGIDVTVDRTEIFGLIGPNGAGKTTLVNVLSGFQKPTTGTITLAGSDVTGLQPHQLARHGVARTFQNVRLFKRLGVLENVEAGAVGVGMGSREARGWASEVLDSVGLGDQSRLEAGTLSHGLQRRLGIARALATKPKFILLDEPAAGLDEGESDGLVETLREIHRRFECGTLIIEHDMRVIMALCHRVQVLDYGKTISIGTPAEVRSDPAVLAAYLGTATEPPVAQD